MIRSRFAMLAALSMALGTGNVVADVSIAEAAGEWSGVATPSPRLSSTLSGVACTSATDCYAVGTTATRTGVSGLVEHFDGTTWAVVSSPAFKGTRLDGVACSSTTDCWAVGDRGSGTRRRAVVGHWDGMKWSVVRTPIRAVESGFSGVACPTATDCYAVGSMTNGAAGSARRYLPLAGHWNGTSWSIARPPKPAGAIDGLLSGVACPSAKSCFAVGFAQTAAVVRGMLVVRWNGAKWSIVPSPNPPKAKYTELAGVSCPSAKSCFAVGTTDYPSSPPDKALIERWNGTKWTIVSNPALRGIKHAELFGVACPSVTACFAVGTFTEGSLIQMWNGTKWSKTSGPGEHLLGVACPDVTTCNAVGEGSVIGPSFNSKTVAAHYG